MYNKSFKNSSPQQYYILYVTGPNITDPIPVGGNEDTGFTIENPGV